MKKIKSITFENFKYFYGKRKFDIDHKHVLLYGENGSGKSSIYWGLYTFLQSAVKSDKQVFKYFKPEDSENLRNRFADTTESSGIAIEFTSIDGSESEETFKINNRFIQTNKLGKDSVEKMLISSDFLDYKYMHRLYDFRNSQKMNLFPLFEREVFRYIQLEGNYQLLDGTEATKKGAKDWWEFIENNHNKLPKLPKNKHTPDRNSKEYERYEKAIENFIISLRTFLVKVEGFANDYLKEHFKEKFTISFDTENINCEYNKKLEGRTSSRDKKLHLPKIPLILYLISDSLEENNKKVSKPHIFLNEAKLTSIALAMRLAMLDERLSNNSLHQILVLDDLLLSLDMSHRSVVLDIILKKAENFQIFLLTHDRLFFEMARHRVNVKGNKNDWKCIEMYGDDKDGIPQPFYFESRDYLGQAKKFLNAKRYTISGNFLRKEAEAICKRFLTSSQQINKHGQQRSLYEMISKSIEVVKSNGLTNQTQSLFNKLNSFRKFALNDSSHDSYEVPKFKNELEECFIVLVKLNRIEVLQDVIPKDTILEFEMKSKHGKHYKMEITIQDDFNIVIEESKAPILMRGMVNYQIYEDGQLKKDKKGNEINHGIESIKGKYDTWYRESDKLGEVDFWQGIKFQDDGRPLKSILPT